MSILSTIESDVMKELLGPVVAELEKEGETDLTLVQAALEAEADALASRFDIPAAVVNGVIGELFASIEAWVAKLKPAPAA